MHIRVGLSVVVLASAMHGLGLPQSAFGQDKGSQQGAFHSQVDLVSVYFTVRDDKKRLVSDLAQDKFSVSENGQPQVITLFAHHSDVVLNVGVLLDTGTNMSWILGEEAQAARLFMKHVVRPTDLGFILSYASRVETVQLPTSDVALLEERADTIGSGEAAIGLPDQGLSPEPRIGMPGGGTVGINGKPVDENREAHLYDAIRLSTQNYLASEVGRKAVVIVALSGDWRSKNCVMGRSESGAPRIHHLSGY
jgi:VWFA-related protein